MALIGWAILVGASLVAGALVAVVLRLPERIAAVVTSFGGGLLVAAIAFELVPEADERAGAVVTALGLLAGTLVYVGADAWLTRDEAMAEMRRSGQAAAAGQPMTMSVDHAEAARQPRHEARPQDAERRAGVDHRLNEPHAVDDARAAVDQVADEDRPASLGVRVGAVGSALVAELGKQLLELVVAAVDVADDVERPAFALAVVPERRPRDRRGLDLLRRAEHVHLPEALLAQPAQRAAKLARLVADHVRAEVAVGPAAVAVLTEPLRQVEDDRDRQEVVLARERDAEIWNYGTLLREQLEEQRGVVEGNAWEKVASLYAAAIGEFEDDAEEARITAVSIGDGLPIIGDEDPRLVFQDEEIERAQRFYLPAARLLAAEGVETAAAAGERDAGALTAGSLLFEWLEEHGYEATEYAREIGFDRRHVDLVCANRIDPVLLSHDLVAAILARPYREAKLDPDVLDAALSRSFDEDANWALVGASGRGRVFARTSGRRGQARAGALRGRLETTAQPLTPDEVERRKRAYINDVLAALEEKTGR